MLRPEKILWISDPHIGLNHVSCPDPLGRLEAALDEMRAHHADAACLVLSGDLAENGLAEEYAALAKAPERMPMPVLPLTGNHDARQAFRDGLTLPDSCMPGFVQYKVETETATILALDTLVEGGSAGALCRARLDWLARNLGTRPVYIFMHHPPIPLGLPAQDGDRFEGADEFFDLLKQHGNVAHVFCGHVHRPVTAHRRGISVTSLRALTIQAPAPWPAWDWDSFAPADETPHYGVILLEGADHALQPIDLKGI